MGMFDVIRVEVPMPDTGEVPVGLDYQTKCLDNTLDGYVIAADNRLYRESWEFEYIKDETHFGGGYLQKIEGTYKRTLVEDYHGDIVFYGGKPLDEETKVWRDYTARFTDGVLTRLTYKDT